MSLAVLLVPSAPSGAAVVRLSGLTDGEASTASLLVHGLPGESNSIAIREVDGVVTVRDERTALLPGDGCHTSGSEVRCPRGDASLLLSVNTTDGDDEILIDPGLAYEQAILGGGSGDDTLAGGSGQDFLAGGVGDDVVLGHAGRDELAGNEGADLLRGGTGTDTASYSASAGTVTVTLDDRPDDGHEGEGDDAGADIERVVGSAPRLRVFGNDSRNVLRGEDGLTDLHGGAGDDRIDASFSNGGTLDGGPGRDSIRAAPANVVDARDGEADRIDCQNGLARLPLVDPVDVLTTCVPAVEVKNVRALVDPAGRFELRIRCKAVGQSCRTRLSLRWEEQDIARRVIRAQPPMTRTTVRLNRRGRRLLRVHGALDGVRGFVESFRTGPAAAGSREGVYLSLRPT